MELRNLINVIASIVLLTIVMVSCNEENYDDKDISLEVSLTSKGEHATESSLMNSATDKSDRHSARGLPQAPRVKVKDVAKAFREKGDYTWGLD